MRRREFSVALVAILAARAVVPGGLLALARAAFALGESEAAAGVREALGRGANGAVDALGRPGGFLDNPRVRIPLPGGLDKAAALLRNLGQGRRVDELVDAMNRAAEAAVPEARPLLVNAVKTMSVEDAVRIVRGGDTSVTDFFAAKTRPALAARFLPIVARETQKVSLAEKYDAVASRGAAFGLVRPEDADVAQYVTRKALDGLFLTIGEQEKRIRADPLGTGSALLAAVFGRR
jgi:hypothetical protein